MFHAKGLSFRAEGPLDNALEVRFVPSAWRPTERHGASALCPAALRGLAWRAGVAATTQWFSPRGGGDGVDRAAGPCGSLHWLCAEYLGVRHTAHCRPGLKLYRRYGWPIRSP